MRASWVYTCLDYTCSRSHRADGLRRFAFRGAFGRQGEHVFNPALVGASNSGDAVVIVQKGSDQDYRIDWLGAEGEATPRIVRMEGRLAKIGDQRILDLTSAYPGAFAIPCHAFLRIRPVKEGLKVQFVDSKWIRDQVPGSLAGFEQDNHTVAAETELTT